MPNIQIIEFSEETDSYWLREFQPYELKWSMLGRNDLEGDLYWLTVSQR